MPDLQIITEGCRELAPQYLLASLVQTWRRRGHSIVIGPANELVAGFGILHYDRTRVPVAAVPKRGPRQILWNEHLLDITKRRVSAQLVSPDDGYEGPVIIKTDDNSYGGPELAAKSPFSLRRIRRRLVPLLGWQLARELPRATYPVLSRRAEVPAWVWQHPDLVVEQFLPERIGGDYALRYWLFAGDRECTLLLRGPEPVLKFRNCSTHEFCSEVPAELRAARTQLGIDFGKIDFVIVGDRAVVLDVNKTPILPAALRTAPEVLQLAEAIPTAQAGDSTFQ